MAEEYTEWWKNPAIKNYRQPNAEVGGAPPATQPIGNNGGSGGNYGYTGKGPDGVAQQDRRVSGMGNGAYDAHESEFVFNADTTQAIGPDVLNSIQDEVKAGRPINVNKIREAIGGNAQNLTSVKPGYQEGGLTPAAIPEKNPLARQANTKQATPTSTTPTPDPIISGQVIGGKTPDPIDIDTNIIDPENQLIIQNVDWPAFNIDPNPKIDMINPIKPIVPNATPAPNAIDKAPVPIGSDPKTTKPDAIGQVPVAGPGKTATGSMVKPDDIGEAIDYGGGIGSKEPGTDEIDPEEFDALEYIKQIMGGDNPYLEQLKNMYSQDMSGAGAASLAAMRQQAAQAGMSPEQIASMSATFGRDSQQAVSKMLGTLALKGTEMQYQAAKDAFSMEMQKKQFDFAKERYGDSKSDQILKDINGGMTLKMIRDKYPDMNITDNDYNAMKKMSNMGWQQEVFNQQMDFSKKQYGDLEGQRIANLVNAGWSLEQLQEEFPDKNITQEDFDQLQSYSNMGFQKEQWEHKKKIDTFNQLIQQGGPENFQTAAKMFNSMFGTNIDFSNAITEENKEMFNESWNNMTAAISGNMTFEDWKKSAIADGTYDNLNMSDSDIKSMYENMQLSNNPTYQALTQYDKMLEMGVLTQEQYDRVTRALKYGISHPEGFTFSDGYQILDKHGNEVEYYKTQEEADEFLENNPDHILSIEKDGWVELDGEEEEEGDGDGDGDGGITDEEWNNMSLQEQSDHFLDSIPADMAKYWYYKKWLDEGKPRTWDEHQEKIGGKIPEYTKVLQEKYGTDGEGWPAPSFISSNNVYLQKFVNKAREDFLRGDNLHSFTEDDFEIMSHRELMTDERFKKGNVISVRGHTNPVVVESVYPSTGGPSKGYILVYDLVTGKKYKLGNDGNTMPTW